MISEKTRTESILNVSCLICGASYDSRASFHCPKCSYPILHFTYNMDAVKPLINRRRETFKIDESKQYQNEVIFKLNDLIQLTEKAPSMANLESAPPYLKSGELSEALRAVWMQLVEQYESDTDNQQTQTNKKTQNKNVEEDRFENVKPGQSIAMGKFNNKPIKWIILERKGDKILVISDEVLDWLPFNNERNRMITWKDCTLRTWLNCDFYLTAFSEKERKAIEYTVVKNQPIGNKNLDTTDQLFLLSDYEVQIHKSIPKVSMNWHLRSLASSGRNHFIADSLKLSGDFTESRGVRPAMLLDLNHLKLKR